MAKTVKTAKKVQIIARYFIKANGYVVYKVRSSNGVDTYCTTLDANGKATACECPAIKPCYHMTGCEAIEATRSADSERDQALAEARQNSEATLAAIIAETEASIAAEQAKPAQPKSEQARIADFGTAPLHSANRGFSLFL